MLPNSKKKTHTAGLLTGNDFSNVSMVVLKNMKQLENIKRTVKDEQSCTVTEMKSE